MIGWRAAARQRRARRRRAALLGLLALVLLSAGGCDAPTPSTAEDGAAELAPLRFGVSTSILATPVRLAIALELFARQGIDVEVSYLASGKAALAELLAGRIDVSTTADAPIMQAALDGESFVVLATFTASSAHGKLLARRSLGVSAPLDLTGKRIGLDKNTTAHFFMQVLLIESGVDLAAIETIDIPTDQLIEALETGTVDAITTWEPNVHAGTNLLGEDAIVFSTTQGLRQTFNLVTRPDLLEQRPRALKRLLAAVGEGADYAREQPGQAQALMAEQLGLPRRMLADIWGDYTFELFLDHGLLLTLEAQARWYLRESGRPDAPLPDFLDYIDPGLLRQLAPGSVTLIR